MKSNLTPNQTPTFYYKFKKNIKTIDYNQNCEFNTTNDKTRIEIMLHLFNFCIEIYTEQLKKNMLHELFILNIQKYELKNFQRYKFFYNI